MNKKSIIIICSIILLIPLTYFLVPKKEIQFTGTVSSQSEKKIKDVTDFYSITATYPHESLDTENVMEDFVKYKVNEMKEVWKIGGEVYREEQKIATNFPDRPKMQYQYDISYGKHESALHGTVSYVFTTYEFTGGANGNTKVNTFTFNKDGRVEIDSVLSLAIDNNDIKLSRVLADTAMNDAEEGFDKTMLYEGLGLAYLKADGKTLDTKKCYCDGFFFGSNFQNFVITDEGIEFLFSKYQIAPGAQGTPKIMLPWKLLQGYLIGSFKGK